MKSSWLSPTDRCSGRGPLRMWSTVMLAAGGLLLAPSGALADHMPGMPNGVACPHASGEGPDAPAAPGPAESPAPERAPSEAPLGTAQTSAPKPAPAPAEPRATRPATKPAGQVTQPATQEAAQPTAQVQTGQPAANAESAPAEAVAEQPVATRAAERPAARRAERPARSVDRRVFERRFNGLEPRPAKPSTAIVEPVAAIAEPTRPAVAPPAPVRMPVLVAFALLTVLGVAGAVAVGRRRGGGGATVAGAPERPAAPSHADAALEAELHEMISEARARTLLEAEPEEARRPAAPR